MRKLWVVQAMIPVVASLWLVTAEGQANPVAKVVRRGGQVSIWSRGVGRWEALQLSRPLLEGDQVDVGRGGVAWLYQPDCPIRELREGEKLVVSRNKRWEVGITKNPLSKEDFSALDTMLRDAGIVRQRGVIRPTVSGPALGRPSGEAVIGPVPFDMSSLVDSPADDPPRPYSLGLFRGRTLIWGIDTTETEFVTPADLVLAPGRYTWKAERQGDLLVEGSFTVPDAQTQETIRAILLATRELVPQGAGPNLPYVAVCLKYKLYRQAESELQPFEAQDVEEMDDSQPGAAPEACLASLLHHMVFLRRLGLER